MHELLKSILFLIAETLRQIWRKVLGTLSPRRPVPVPVPVRRFNTFASVSVEDRGSYGLMGRRTRL